MASAATSATRTRKCSTRLARSGESRQPSPSAEEKRRPPYVALDGFQSPSEIEGMRLNRFLAAAGFGSRRNVEELIKEGRVRINGHLISELATKVAPEDVVKV